jgi:hypothetical protein
MAKVDADSMSVSVPAFRFVARLVEPSVPAPCIDPSSMNACGGGNPDCCYCEPRPAAPSRAFHK